MVKGFLTGGLSGLALGGFAVIGLSVIAEQPAGNTPPDAPQVSAPTTAQDVATPDVQTEEVLTANLTDPVLEISPTPGIAPAAAMVPDAPDRPITDTTPLNAPIAIDSTVVPSAPVANFDVPIVVASAEDPVLPNPQSIAPQIPMSENDVVITTTPVAPPEAAPAEAFVTVEVEPELVPAEPEPEPEPEQPEPEPEQVEVIEIPDLAPEIVEAPVLIMPEAGTEFAGATAEIEAAPMPAVTPVITQPEAETEVLPNVGGDSDDAATVTVVDTKTNEPTVVTLIGDRQTNLPSGAGQVPVNRLGQLTEEAETESVADAVVVPEGATALERYAAVSENPAGMPTLSVVLIDDGSFAGAVPAIAGVPFPVSVMLDPGAKGVADKMAAYRAAGIEVGVLAKLPTGATTSDVLVYFESAFSDLPDTMAVLDVSGVAFQADAETAKAAIGVIAEDGRGLVAVSQGLNTALREADKAGVPSALIYRDLDGEGQDARVIRRFMDQAAFRARQDTGVIMLGRVRADTVSALILWGTANRAGQVAMVPVSSILLAK